MTEQMKEILLAELHKLSPLAQKAVHELLATYAESSAAFDAENFLLELTAVPMTSKSADKNLIIKLNQSIDTLRNSPRWFDTENLPHEIWRDVEGYAGFYQVSIFSRVKSFYRKKERIMKLGTDIDGYSVVSLSKDGKDRVFGVHTLVARAFIDNPGDKPEVNHIDGIKNHSCIWNLEWVTCSENARHAVKQDLRKVGSENPCAKLNTEQAEEVLGLYIKGSSEFGIYGLAKKFNVHPATIHGIISGKTYKNLKRLR